MNIDKDLVAASATPLILGILSDGESYGYEIIKRVAEISDDELSWTDGMLYPVLHRLEKNGLITSKWLRAENGRRRKYYRLSADGVKELSRQKRQWNIVDEAIRKSWRFSVADRIANANLTLIAIRWTPAISGGVPVESNRRE